MNFPNSSIKIKYGQCPVCASNAIKAGKGYEHSDKPLTAGLCVFHNKQRKAKASAEKPQNKPI